MSNVQILNFHDLNVRTDIENDTIWFCAKDVCDILGYDNPWKAVKDHIHNDDLTKREVIDSMGRTQKANFVNESGMYALIFGSKLDSAKEFKRWVTSEVLPQIRKTGQYAVPKIDKSLSYVKKLDVIKQSLPSEIGATLDEIIDKAKKQGFMIASNPNCKNATRLDMNVNAEERLFDMFNKLNLSVEAKAELKRTLEEIRDNEANRVRANALEELKPIKKFIDTVGMYQDELRDFTAKSLRQSDCPPIMPFICASLPQLRHKLG